jgi:DnaJ-class molecular chaperone
MTNKRTCLACNGKGYIWYPNGGPHGIGNQSRCKKCNGKGRL